MFSLERFFGNDDDDLKVYEGANDDHVEIVSEIVEPAIRHCLDPVTGEVKEDQFSRRVIDSAKWRARVAIGQPHIGEENSELDVAAGTQYAREIAPVIARVEWNAEMEERINA